MYGIPVGAKERHVSCSLKGSHDKDHTEGEGKGDGKAYVKMKEKKCLFTYCSLKTIEPELFICFILFLVIIDSLVHFRVKIIALQRSHTVTRLPERVRACALIWNS